MNIASTIIPKSDQLNADDLIAGDRTIKITGVKAGSSPEQPVSIHYEGDSGRPYKPCKSMRRVLVALWGDEATAYIGRRLTLVRDPDVKFGGDTVGGIRISHASDIDRPATLALTVTRGKRKPYTVQPLASDAQVSQGSTPANVPDAWHTWTHEMRGDFICQRGVDALRAWWESISIAQRKACATKLDGWKEIAAKANAS